MANRDEPTDDLHSASTETDGTHVSAQLTAQQTADQPATSEGNGPVVNAATAVHYTYDSTTACTMNPPGSLDADEMCPRAAQACADPANGPGPLMRIWRRDTNSSGGVVRDWHIIGLTCYSNLVPNARPMLTMAMIQEAFNLTPWAKANTLVEPVGNVTLVGLDTFYRVEWSAEGFEPGEVEAIDPGRMLGYQVDIRPKLVGLTYKFGDGSEFGPTPSLGGRYPDGSIRHQYEATGAVAVGVSVTWGADYRIDGSEWAEVPDRVTVAGPTTPLEVKAARAVLVQR
jgi:hypothetical protein